MANGNQKTAVAKNLDTATKVTRALGHPLRMKILEFIDVNRKTNVNKIYKALKVEQSITSQHLRILRDAKIVLAQRQGKFIFYTLNYNKLKQIQAAVSRFFAE